MKLIISLFFLIFTCFTNSQNFRYGISLGNDSYAVNGDSSNSFGPSENFFGFNAGVYLDYRVNNKIGIITNLNYTKRELTFKANNFISSQDFLINADFLELSVSIKRNFSGEYFKKGYFKAGVKYSNMIKSSSFEDTINSNRIGVLAGFGYDFEKYFGIETSLSYDINNLYENESKQNLSMFVFNISMKLNLGFLSKN